MNTISSSKLHARPRMDSNHILGIDASLLFVSLSIILIGLMVQPDGFESGQLISSLQKLLS